MSDSVYSFRSGPTYRAASRQELFDSAMEQPLSLTSTFFDQAKGGMLESYGLGTAIRDFAIPEGAATPETTVRSALRLTNPLTAAYESTRLAVQAFREDSPTLDETKYKASPYYRENIPWDAGMTEARAKALAEWSDAKQVRQYYAQKRPISAFLGNLTGQAFDPINYVPVGGPLVRAAAVARAGRIGGAVITGAVDAATNTALAGLATRETRGRFGDDVSFQAMVSEIATAALIGAAFGGVSGAMEARKTARALADAQRTLSTLKTTQEARIALNEAIDGVVRGEDVNLTPNATEPMRRVAEERPNTKPSEIAVSSEGTAIWARASYDNGSVPEGWYVHGRSGRQDLDTNYVLQLTRDWQVAEQYGRSGSMWVIRPREDAKVFDFLNDEAGDLDRLIEFVKARFHEGVDDDPVLNGIRDSQMDDVTEESIEEAIRANFAPSDIVNSAGAYDNADWVQWLWDNFEADFVRTPDGAIVINKDAIEAVRVPSGDEVAAAASNPAIDTPAPRPEPVPEGRALAETRIAKPDNYKALADQYRVDPETGDFPELADIDNLRAEGRLTADDIAELDAAASTVDDAKAYGEALRSVVACLV